LEIKHLKYDENLVSFVVMNLYIKTHLPGWLKSMNIESLNEMQHTVLQKSKDVQDIHLLAPTGSGKTLAFLLSILSKVDLENSGQTQALIVVPTRELALQIEQVWRTMNTGFKITSCYGGHKREIEENNLIEPPLLIVGTPGRLADHLRRGNINTDHLELLVIDEYDKSVEWGFQADIEEVVSFLKHINFVLLASATMADVLPDFLPMGEPELVDFRLEEEDEPLKIDVKHIVTEKKDKLTELAQLLCRLGERRSVIFCNHKEVVERVTAYLTDLRIPNAHYHGSMQQFERELALFQFRSGTVNFLVTTDLAARGLDIDYIRNIIHYNIPFDEATYTHRNGRTARQERSGSVFVMQAKTEELPEFIEVDEVWTLDTSGQLKLPERSKWSTVYVPLGRKNKVSRGDFVGFFTNRGGLKFEDVGLIEVKDFISYIAIRRSKVGHVMEVVKTHRIKNKKVKMHIVK